MPDLDRLFQALQSDADLVPSADVSVVRALGRRRRVRQTTVSLVAVALVVGAVLVGPALWPRAARPPADVSPTTVTFTPLRAIGGEGVTFTTVGSGRPTSVATAIAGGRGYVVWQGDNGVPTVAALDVATGRRLWGPVTLDPAMGWTGIYALPQAVVVVNASADGNSGVVMVLDPTSGEMRWQRRLHAFDGVGYESAAVFADRSTGVTEAVDWRSGQTLWKVTDPSGSLVTVLGMRTSEDMSAPGPYPVLPYSDHRLVEVGGDRIVRVYDAFTGQLLGSRAALGNEALAYNGTVFAARDATATVPNQVLAYQAVGTDAPRIVYQSPHATTRLRSLAPCGARRICFIEGYGMNGGADADLVAVDLDARASVWRTHSGDLDLLTPMGERVLGRTNDGFVGLYGAERAAVLVQAGSADLADRVDDGSVLLLRSATTEASQSVRDTDVVGVVVSTGKLIALGRIQVWLSSCSWDTRHLLCATSTGFQVWGFAAD
jgi:outer membrane protein assembly factor BamB